MTTKAVSATVSSFPTKPPWLVEGEKMSARREKGQGEFPPMLLGPAARPHTCMPLCITGQESRNEPSACCWVSSHLIVSCSFSGEPPTCSWAKLSTFSTKAVSLEHGRGQMGIGTGPDRGHSPTSPGTWLVTLPSYLALPPAALALLRDPEPLSQPHQVLLSRCNHAP